MDSNLKRAIILDNYQNPRNKGLIDNNDYIKVNMNNESCIDEIDVMARIENKVIKDIKFDGEACAICTSSASIMTSTLKNKTIDESKEIITNFYQMIDEKEYDEEILAEAVVYNDISKQPNRKKCALLPWWGIEKAINKNNK